MSSATAVSEPRLEAALASDRPPDGPPDQIPDQLPSGPATAAPSGLPHISAVVPAYNAAAHIAACLDSILAQQGRWWLEVIVVDDGSTDATAAIVAARAARHPNLRLLQQPNAGPAAARNRGIAAASGELIAFLDSDDLWPAGRLAAQLAIFDAHPEVGLVFGDCALFDADGPVLASYFAAAGLDDGFFGDAALVTDAPAKLFRLNFIPTGAVLVRRALLLAAGGFDARLRLVEDLDLWLRLAEHCRLGYTRALCQRKRQHPGNVSADFEGMTLANLAVLGRYWQRQRAMLRARGLRFAPYAAREYSLLGDHHERAGRRAEARRWYLRALLRAPGPRPLFYLLRSLWPWSR